jgi:hypothetical protein
MESLIFHLVVISGTFLLGRLSRSVTIVGFKAKPAKTRSMMQSSGEGSRG